VTRGRSKTKDSRISQLDYADLTETADYKLRIRVSELVESVKQAFKEKRRRDCTALAKTILELDPQNDDARFILSWIECDLERDLQLARALLPDLKTDETLYKNAQLIVQTVLDIDPANKAAEGLQLEIDSLFQSSHSRSVPQDASPAAMLDRVEEQTSVIETGEDANRVELDSVQAEVLPVAVEDPTPALDAATEVTTVPDVESKIEAEAQVAAEPQTPEPSALKAQPEIPDVPVTPTPPPIHPVFEAQPKVHSITRTDSRENVGAADARTQVQSLPKPEAQAPAKPQTNLQFQAVPRPRYRVDVDSIADNPGLLPHRKFWKHSYVIIGFLVLVLGLAALIRTVGLPDWLAGDPETRSDSANVPVDSKDVGTSMASASGDLEISIDEGVEVFVNDQYAGKAPIAPIKLKPGVYELRYKLDQTELGSEQVTVAADQISRNSKRAVLGSLEIFVLPASATVMQIDDSPAGPVQTHVVLKPGKHKLTFTAAGFQPQTVFASVTEGRSSNVTAILQPAIIDPTPRSSAAAPPSPSGVPGVRNNTLPVATGKGTLAVSSLLPVDIYLNNDHLGTTPVTLELPAGTYTFEYRYGNLRKSGVNVIKNNELTRATVVFEVTLQINSMPQAEVSLAGIQPKVLGRTPLTSVRVPIGSTLLFRTSGYPEKSYTVTEKDTTISVVFP
jgi:hypothetical protein